MGDVVALALELLRVPSTTGEEGAIADLLEARYRDRGDAVRVGQSLVVGDLDDRRPQILLVGHVDVVPPTDADRDARLVEDHPAGPVLVGRGASDMKGGLAVAMAAFEDPACRSGGVAPVLVAYAGEEGAAEGNELHDVLEAVPQLADAALAVVLEPTDLAVQLGCLGGLHALVVVEGRAAHSARPWHGENALTKAGPLLTALGAVAPRDVVVDGLRYRDVVTATTARTLNARNVVPDRFEVDVNLRFAPDRGLDAAEAELRALLAELDDHGVIASVDVVDRAPPAPPHADAPALRRFVDVVGAPVEPKQAWTDVARFAALGVPALNYGPGLTAQAHQAGEYVLVADLLAADAALRRYLAAR